MTMKIASVFTVNETTHNLHLPLS